MSTTISAGQNGGIVFIVNGTECPLTKEDATELAFRLRETGTDEGKQVAHKIEEAMV